MLAFLEPLADRPDPTADPVSRLEDRHVGTDRIQLARRGEPSQTGPNHDDGCSCE